MGKKKLNDLAGAYILKTPGKPTLAPESDKRPAILENSKTAFAREEGA